jgi:outer membrane receptor protein involved in Fe transport
MKYRFFIASFVCLLCFCQYSFAQKILVKGLIINEQNKQPIEYASISLLTKNDSTIIIGSITNKKGIFSIETKDTGTFIIKIFFIGFKPYYSDILSGSNNQKIDLGTIPLIPATNLLNNVTVSATSTFNQNKIDKQSFKASQFETAKGGTAVDLLKNLPSVTVNAQGEISLRGSLGFLVLINNKPIITDAATTLGQLPANIIENIELITAPSAKYDPDGKGGIINIITKKGTTDGLGIIANIQGGLPSTTNYKNKENPIRFGADLNINIKQKKWDIAIGGNYLRNDVNGRREGDVFTKNFINNTITRFPSSGERSFDKYNYGTRTSIIFTSDKFNTFSFGFYLGKRFQVRRADILYYNSTSNLTTNALIRELIYFNSNIQTKEGNFTLGNFDYTYTFKNKSSLSTSILYERSNLFGNTLNQNLVYPQMNQMFQEVYNPYSNPITGYRAKIDYTTFIGTAKLETGYQFRKDNQDGQFDYSVTPANSQPDAARFRGSVKAKNTINGLYSQISGKAKKLQYAMGLRYEYAERTLNLSYESNAHYLSLSNLFPSINLLYTINNSLNYKIGYSKRIQRTNNFELNPIPEREHSETLEQGDPELLPQFIDLAEIGLNHRFKTGSLFATLYFQNIKNPIQRVNSVYADTILNRIFTNAERAELFGLEIGTTLKLKTWWNWYIGANLYHYAIDGKIDILGVVKTVSNNSWVYSLNTNSNFNLGKNWSTQLTINYTSNKPTALGDDSRFFVPTSSLKKTFGNGKYSVGFQWQNMNLGFMNANQQRITTSGNDFYTTTNYIYETDILLLNFSINLNKIILKSKMPVSEIGEKEF